jgi:hypothetical protein
MIGEIQFTLEKRFLSRLQESSFLSEAHYCTNQPMVQGVEKGGAQLITRCGGLLEADNPIINSKTGTRLSSLLSTRKLKKIKAATIQKSRTHGISSHSSCKKKGLLHSPLIWCTWSQPLLSIFASTFFI